MFDHCLYFNSTALARTVEREWTAAYAVFGLTPPQGFVLRVVLAREACLASEIAETLAISRPTATRLIDTLCGKGLIERHQAEADGREWRIVPTEAGKAMAAPLNHASAQIAQRLKRKVGAERFERTVDEMKTIRSSLT
ncbi:MarR family winged helix-turn-helix transcriptional regulator [Robbsia sp. KACC 23696]|uniref:MarR family winged helix-turn-helix transcriptional regulator n=1 Tax=Robbsia sp. KACC 23696 TaxID=3149231 RepID=UPI00325B4287